MSADKLARGMPYIVADKVTKSFGSHQVLKGVSTQFCTGEVTVIIGASGSGKSTLLRAINRLEPHDGGRITIDGVEVTDNEATLQKQRCEVGMVFQQFNLFGHMTVLDNVTLAPRRIHKTPRAQANAKAMALLERVGMQAHAHKYPWQLSGGQQQRVALARALAPRPRLLLLDEPLSALDAQVRTELRSEIRQLQRQLGIASIMVTHDQEEALSMADRVVLMHQGRIEQQGSPEQLYAQPVSQFAAGFVGRMNLLPATAEGADQVRIGEASLRCALAGFERGDALLVGVRPESVVLHPAQPTALPNLLRARVVETSFLGSMALVRLYSPTLQCQVDAQWPLRHDVGLPDWLQGEVLMELPAAALQPLAAPDARKAA